MSQGNEFARVSPGAFVLPGMNTCKCICPFVCFTVRLCVFLERLASRNDVL